MFIVRTQFNSQIAEQTFQSEAQAIVTAHKSYQRGGWQHIQVINTETNTLVVEFGESPQSALNKAYRSTHAKTF